MDFLVNNQANQLEFFKQIFLVANIRLKIIFGMLFFALSIADIDFLGKKLR